MAVTATLVNARAKGLRYLLTQDGGAGTTLTITTTGAATPDVLTDAPAGPIRQIAKCFTQGYGSFPAGGLSVNQALALWLARPLAGPFAFPLARCAITPRDGATAPGWRVDASVDGGSHPILNIAAQAGAGTAYLDIELEAGAIGA